METLEIIKKRSEPAIFIVNLKGEFIYINDKARVFISSMQPPQFREKLKEILNGVNGRNPEPLSSDSPPHISNGNGGDYYFRPLLLSNGNHSDIYSQHILVLIEQISKNRTMIDFDYVRRVYGLTHREEEIVGLLLEGLANKEIAQRLFICEYTVKDHLKNIMEKLAVNTRIGIVSKLLHLL